MPAAKIKASRHAVTGLLARTTSVYPWRRPPRHVCGTKRLIIGVSRPRAVPAVVTGRTVATANAVRKLWFAPAQELRIECAQVRNAPWGSRGSCRSLGRAGAEYLPHNIVIA